MSRPYLTTRQAAQIIAAVYGSCEPRTLVRHIDAGCLEAEVTPPVYRRGHRSFRIYPSQFSAYLKVYWPRVQWGMERSA